MTKQNDQKENELYRAVDEVLHYIWDPIGVAGIPQARDEYRSYVPEVIGRIKNGSGELAIVNYLSKVVTENMCLNENSARNLEVAKILLEWNAKLQSGNEI